MIIDISNYNIESGVGVILMVVFSVAFVAFFVWLNSRSIRSDKLNKEIEEERKKFLRGEENRYGDVCDSMVEHWKSL